MSFLSTQLSAKRCGWRTEWKTSASGQPAPCGIRLSSPVDEHHLLEIHHHPDRSARIVIGSHEHPIDPVASSNLLRAGCRAAHEGGATSLRCLTPKDSSWNTILLQQDFAVRHALTSWHATVLRSQAESSAMPEGVCILETCAQLLQDANRVHTWMPTSICPTMTRSAIKVSTSNVQQVLTRIVNESTDVRERRDFTAEGQLKLWSLMNVPVRIYVAVVNNSIAGLVVTSHSSTPGITIEYCGVVTEFRRRGIGRALVNAAQDSAFRQIESREQILQAAAATGNTPAEAFYRHIGLQSCDAGQLWVCEGQPPGNRF